jgi:hypothetical protein
MKRIVLAVAWVLIAVGPAMAQDRDADVKNLVGNLADTDWKVAADASDKLSAIGEPALDGLIEYVKSSEPDLAQVEKRVAELVVLLGSEEWETREKASKELVGIGKPAVPRLREAAKSDPDVEVKMRAEMALDAIALEKASAGASARCAAIRLIGRIGHLKPADSVPLLIGLLKNGDTNVQHHASFSLRRITLQDIAFSPYWPAKDIDETIGKWNAWWRDCGGKVPDRPDPAKKPASVLCGNTLIVEQGRNRVVEVDPDGKDVWEFSHETPYSAQRLDNGNTLMTFWKAGPVTEVDKSGKVVRELQFRCAVSAKKLASGNYLVTEYNSQRVVEVDEDGKVIFDRKYGSDVFDADRLDNGNTLLSLGSLHKVIEIDRAGEKVWEADFSDVEGYPLSADRLEDGNTLVALLNGNAVVEVDSAGRTVWHVKAPGASDAHRLHDGNTLITCHNDGRVVEVDGKGEEVSRQQYDMPLRAER